MKKIDTVVQDVYDVMKSKDYTGDLGSIAMVAGREVEDAIKEAFEPRQQNGNLRMSTIGKCERAQWYNCHGHTPEELKGEVFLTFLQGHILESVLVALLKLSGHKVEDQQKKHTLEGINGSQDCTIDGELVDIKTASAWSWDNKFKENGISDDAFGYIKQLSAYGKTDDRKHGYFLAFNKNKSTLKLCKQDLEQDIDTYVVDLKSKMESDTPPMRLPNATTWNKAKTEEKLCMTCAFCGFKEDCFGKLDARPIPSGKITNYFVTGADF
tara:strand:+ start:1922 stop:2725 length:804 start_codon:yes stop_codon:yes gene_type:complete